MSGAPDLRGWTPLDAKPAAWHVLLLRAALCGPDEALAAWRAFAAAYDFMKIDHGAARLLPLVYHNLKDLEGWDEPRRERLKGIYRYHWARGSRMLHHARRAANLLRENGIDVAGIKGCALVPEVYRDPGLRPMQDIDLWIEPQRLDAAVAALETAGWRPRAARWRDMAAYSGVVVLVGEDVPDIDLHTGIYVSAAENARAWSECRPAASGEPWRIPGPADALMHGGIHGTSWDRVAPVRWLADAATQMRDGSWSRECIESLVRQCRRTASVAHLEASVRQLRGEVGLAGLEAFAAAFEMERAPLFDRAMFFLRARAGASLPGYVRAWVRYRQLRRDGAEIVRDKDFVAFVTGLRGYRDGDETRYRLRGSTRKTVVRHAPRLLRAWDATRAQWFERVRRPLPVCVIVPVRDRYAYLQEALRSVLRQTRPPRSIVVVDDGSTEDVRVAAKSVDPRIRVIRIEAAGPAAARNAGVAVARQRFVAFLDSDDVWLPEKLAMQHAAMASHPEAGMVFCRMDEFFCPNATRDVSVELRQGQPALMPSAALIRRKVVQAVGDQDPALRSGEFIDWYARARDAGVQEYVVDQVLVRRRVHGGNRALEAEGRSEALAGLLKRALDRKRAAAKDGGLA